ncbi:MAG: hypothetical protein GY953_33640, partial [bacterium]|nr:hypothetical protein [bacterium]
MLERIGKERRRRWEEAELAKMKAKGKVPKDDRWKGKYTDPIPVELTDLWPDLPATWCWASLELVTDPVRVVRYGILKPGPNYPGGITYVKVKHIHADRIKTKDLPKTSPEIEARYVRARLAVGDLLLSIRGTVGKVAPVPDELDGGNITQDSARIAPLPGIQREYLALVLRSPQIQCYFSKIAKGVAVQGVNIRDIRPMRIPLPPEQEQTKIVELATVHLDGVAAQSSLVAHSLVDCQRLDKAILGRAFRGDLVPQDPDDEPASKLLERIRAA